MRRLRRIYCYFTRGHDWEATWTILPHLSCTHCASVVFYRPGPKIMHDYAGEFVVSREMGDRIVGTGPRK